MKNVVFDFHKVIYDPGKGEIREDVLTIIKSLNRRNIPIHIFTNSSIETLERMDRKTPFLHYFENIFHELPKPQPQSLQKLIEEVGTSPSLILLIDDSGVVVERAGQYGIQTIKYSPTINLKEDIEEFLGTTLGNQHETG